MIYMLQYINTIHALSMIIGAYRANIMDNLPWRIINLKGCLKVFEMVMFDINEWPSIHITNFVRDDCIMISAYVFWAFSVESKRYNQKMRWIMANKERVEENSVESVQPKTPSKDIKAETVSHIKSE